VLETRDGPVVTGDILLAANGKGDWKSADRRVEVCFPQDLAGLIVKRSEVSRVVSTENQSAARSNNRKSAGTLLIFPGRLAGFHGDSEHCSNLVHAERDLLDHLDPVNLRRIALVRGRRRGLTHVLQWEVHGVGQRTVSACRPVFPARASRASDDGLVDAL
jgi:hypothetical protein